MSYPVFNYRLKTETESFGDVSLQLCSLANLNETIDELFGMAGSGSPADDAEMLEALCPYFGVVWPSARGLCVYLAELPTLKDATVLEVGCGLAVPSLLSARRGALVTATDFHPDIPRFLEKNCDLNQIGSIRYLAQDWSKVSWEGKGSQLGRYDWVIGSDILYEKKHPGPVAKTLAAHCAPGGKVVLADPGRPYLQTFTDEMKKLGFSCSVKIKNVNDSAEAQAQRKDIFVLEFERV